MNPSPTRYQIRQDAAAAAAQNWTFDDRELYSRALHIKWDLLMGRAVTDADGTPTRLDDLDQNTLMTWCRRAADRSLRVDLLNFYQQEIREQARIDSSYREEARIL